MRALITGLVSCLATIAVADDYTIYSWVATSVEMRDKYGEHLASRINYEGAPLDRDGMLVLNAGSVGLYPFAGVHVVESDPTYMARHFDRMKHYMGRWTPPGYDGIVMIDYESWWASWDHTVNKPSSGGPEALDKDFKDDWTEYIEQHRPEVIAGKTGVERELALRDSYEEAAMRFMIETLRECRRLYPDARWGYYNYPKGLYGSGLTPRGVIGYGDLSHYASEVNDRLAPLWEAIDVTMPRIYPVRVTTVDREDKQNENLPEQQYGFITSHVLESKRLAPDKPCIPLGSTRYYGHPDPAISDSFLTKRNTWMQFAVPRDAGADGVLIWGDAIYETYAQRTIEYMNNIAVPVAQELWETWYPDSASTGQREPSASSVRTVRKSPAPAAGATRGAIPGDLRIRQVDPVLGRRWGAIRTGGARVSFPAHSPVATASSPVHRGGRIIGRRSTGYGESPPQHIPALGSGQSGEEESGEGASGEEQSGSGQE